ncbi:hypothetical protein P7F88_10960 [Vibrio hannami]|nr:hypothetical protein [Vibrio hannami]MDG3086603.1 hypothetical protein [Vibrio hannami]
MIDVPSAPHQPAVHTEKTDDLHVIHIYRMSLFFCGKVGFIRISGIQTGKAVPPTSVIKAEGSIISGENEYVFKKGDHILLPHGFENSNFPDMPNLSFKPVS